MKLSRLVQSACLCAASLATLPSAHAQSTPAPEPPAPPAPAAVPHTTRVAEQTVQNALVSWGCQPQALLALAEHWLAACGTAGVFVVAEGADGTLALVERRTAPGAVASVFAREGTLWVETVHRDARPLADLPALAAPQEAPLQVGATSQSETTAPVHVAAGAASPPTRAAQAPSESTVAPSRIGDVVMAQAGARPFLPLNSQKFALLAEFDVSYRSERPWYVQARILPLGLGVGDQRNILLFGGSVVAGYDQQYFSVGVGVGAARRGALVTQNNNGLTSEHFEQNVRFSVTQAARLGALDGLHLAAQSSFVLLSDHWALAFFELKGQIPINRETWLSPAGGGGRQTGFFYLEMGLRRLLHGDRGAGSLFLRPSVGMAAIDARDTEWHRGPMVGVHLEWRQ